MMFHYTRFLVNTLIMGWALGAGPAMAQDSPFAAPTIPYTYPFGDGAMAQQLNSAPVVIELFTSLDCLFCPRAEKLVADLDSKTNATILVYHTDPVGAAYPLARDLGPMRQTRYAETMSDGLLYTPQMVINGHIDAVGYEFEDVARGLKLAAADAVAAWKLRPATGADQVYKLDLPKTELPRGQSADVMMMVVRPPYTVPRHLRQARAHPDPLVRVVTRSVPLGAWDGRAKTVTISVPSGKDAAAFVVLAQRSDGVIIGLAEGP